MPRQTTTIKELINNLKCRYELEGLDIDRLLINYHRCDTAKNIYLETKTSQAMIHTLLKREGLYPRFTKLTKSTDLYKI